MSVSAPRLCTAHLLGLLCGAFIGAAALAADSYIHVSGRDEFIFVESYRDKDREKIGFRDVAKETVLEPQFDSVGEFHEGMVKVRVDEEYGFVNARGELVVKPQFSDAGDFHEGLATAQVTFAGAGDKDPVKKWGYIDKSGKMVIAPQFHGALAFSGGLAPASIPEWQGHGSHAWGYIDRNGKLVVEYNFKEAGQFRDGMAKVKLAAYWGTTNDAGDPVLVKPAPHGHDEMECPEKLHAVWLPGYGYIDRTGKLVIEPQFEECEGFSEGLARARSEEKWGYTNKAGAFAIPARFDGWRIRDFSGGLAAVQEGEDWGFMDQKGTVAVKPQFKEVGDFHEGLARVLAHVPELDITEKRKEYRWGYIDQKGEMVIAPLFAEAQDFRDGIAFVGRGKYAKGYINKQCALNTKSWHLLPEGSEISSGLVSFSYLVDLGYPKLGDKEFVSGYFDRFGRLVIGTDFVRVRDFSEGLSCVEQGNLAEWKCGFIDRTGKVVIEPKYSEAWDSSEGLALVETLREGRRGASKVSEYLNKKGETEVGPFMDGQEVVFDEKLARVELDGKYGCVDETGRLVIPARFTAVDAFKDGMARVAVGGRRPWDDSRVVGAKWGYIDTDGRDVIKPDYDYLGEFSGGLIRFNVGGKQDSRADVDAVRGGKWGYLNDRGREVIKAQFEDAQDFREGRAGVKVKGKWGYIDRTGKLAIPAMFSDALPFWGETTTVTLGGKEFLIDKSGQVVRKDKPKETRGGGYAVVDDTPISYTREVRTVILPSLHFYSFSEGFAAFNSGGYVTKGDYWPTGPIAGGKWGFINRKGERITEPRFDAALGFYERLAAVKAEEKWGYVNELGMLIIEPRFDAAWSFSEGLAAVGVGKHPDTKYGYIKWGGLMAIEPQFVWAGDFSEGLAPVCVRGEWAEGELKDAKYGYVNRKGELVIEPQFSMAYRFQNGYAAVRVFDRWGYIDRNGKRAFPSPEQLLAKADAATGEDPSGEEAPEVKDLYFEIRTDKAEWHEAQFEASGLLSPGDVVRLVAVFAGKPRAGSREVELTLGGGDKSKIMVFRSESNPRKFMSREILILPSESITPGSEQQ